MQENNNREHIVGAVAIFIATTLLAIMMLLISLLLFISDLIGSMIGALLILGLLSAIISLTLYFMVVRPEISALRREMASIYEIANLARSGYDWIMRHIELFIKNL